MKSITNTITSSKNDCVFFYICLFRFVLNGDHIYQLIYLIDEMICNVVSLHQYYVFQDLIQKSCQMRLKFHWYDIIFKTRINIFFCYMKNHYFEIIFEFRKILIKTNFFRFPYQTKMIIV